MISFWFDYEKYMFSALELQFEIYIKITNNMALIICFALLD